MSDPLDQVRADRYKSHMEGDYPGVPHGQSIQMEFRMANAAEYSAYQLGQINQSLKKIVALLEKGTK